MRILLFLTFIISACSTLKKSENSTSDIPIPPKEMMSFFVFNIHTDSIENKNKIELVSQIKSEGKFKNNDKEFTDFPNYLTIELFSKNILLKTFKIEHPLYQNIEYVEEGEWKTKSFVVLQADFFLRIQLENNPTELKILETLKDKKTTELYTLKL